MDQTIPAIKHLTQTLGEGDTVTIAELDMTFAVLEVPGHTLDHIAYHCGDKLFCGDTLFSGGCGRLFEGTPQQMHDSLEKLKALDDSTQVYCTHEYTLANLDFAGAVEPDNQALRQYTISCKQKRQYDEPTLPSRIGMEKAINPFLRSTEHGVITAAKSRQEFSTEEPDQVFSVIRRWKDQY